MDPTNITNAVANGDSNILLILIGIGGFYLSWYTYDQAKKWIKERFFS